MHTDYEFWRNLVPPAAPDENDKKLFKRLIIGDTVLLLGSTKILLDLATDAYDLSPKWDDPKIQDRDWRSVDKNYDTIIGCGPFNFTKEFADELFPILRKHCKRLIIRVIKKPTWTMKYGVYFPEPNDFAIRPVVHSDSGSHMIYVWDFK